MHEKLLEREIEKYREKQREESKSRKKLEANFLRLLGHLAPPLTENSTWEEVRPQIAHDEWFHAIKDEDDRRGLFESAVRSLADTCSHNHNQKKKMHHHPGSAGPSKGNKGTDEKQYHHR